MLEKDYKLRWLRIDYLKEKSTLLVSIFALILRLIN
jgi:hypothetical protein